MAELLVLRQRQRKFHRRSRNVISTKILHSTPVERDENSFVVHRALSHPGFLHAALLMTALQWGWLSGDGEQFRVPYLYHKLQAIRFVNEQLADPEMVVDEGTIAAVASLALVENSLGSAEAMASHLCGLLRIQEMQGKKGRRGTTSLLQRLIQMTARCVKSRRVSNIFDLNRTDQVHQSMIVSLLRIALRPTYDIFILDRDDAPAQTLFEILSKSSQNQSQDNQAVAPLRSVDYSRSDFISSYFYLYAILRENEVDSFILNFFLEQLLVDVCRTEPQMHSGQYSQSLWFWTVMFGACASNIAKVTSPLEAEQIQAIRDVYMVKIHLASQVLGISNWEGAKSKLRLFAWEDGFDGEEELRGLWEDAMWLDRYRPGASFALESAVLTTAA
ncbi:hypothetical protein BX600DRAFT_508807 [Xylariales sp. PMI_506]|nr:hypothetical protein BX600DRAFT_508807 [Xylariales sp. PMI_506]